MSPWFRLLCGNQQMKSLTVVDDGYKSGSLKTPSRQTILLYPERGGEWLWGELRRASLEITTFISHVLLTGNSDFLVYECAQCWLVLQLPRISTDLGNTAFWFCAPYTWNQLQHSLEINTSVVVGLFENLIERLINFVNLLKMLRLAVNLVTLQLKPWSKWLSGVW